MALSFIVKDTTIDVHVVHTNSWLFTIPISAQSHHPWIRPSPSDCFQTDTIPLFPSLLQV